MKQNCSSLHGCEKPGVPSLSFASLDKLLRGFHRPQGSVGRDFKITFVTILRNWHFTLSPAMTAAGRGHTGPPGTRCFTGLQSSKPMPNSRRQALHASMPSPNEEPVLVFQLHDGLHGSVVVIEVDSSHHLGPLQVSDFHRHFADGVAANELHDLLGGGVPSIHFNGRQLDILKARVYTKHCISSRRMAHPFFFKLHQCNPLFIHG